MQPGFPRHSPAERRADAIVHAVGLALAVIGCLVLLATTPADADLFLRLGLGVYAVGLLAMLACSALYNLSRGSHRKALYQRLDHGAIFLMIAGTYTPFTLTVLGDGKALALLALVWTMALVGGAVELAGVRRPEALLTVAYLLMGWVIVVQLEPLAVALSRSGFLLLVAGGVLYTVGAVFHHWRQLPYQNAIWHGFVVTAAACHYAAILREVAPGFAGSR